MTASQDATPSGPDAFAQSAYRHCARLAIGMLTSRGSLSPQLFFVGPPADGADASASRMALAGEQALAAFHTSPDGAERLSAFIESALDPHHAQGQALAQQLGRVAAAVHACHVLLPADVPMMALEDGTPASAVADGRRECLLIKLHLPGGSQYAAMCPVVRDAGSGALRAAIAPLRAA